MTLETTPSAAARLSAPHIVTELPGPRAQALIARDDAVVSPSLTRAYPLVAETGDGSPSLHVPAGNLVPSEPKSQSVGLADNTSTAPLALPSRPGSTAKSPAAPKKTSAPAPATAPAPAPAR